jgi:stress response protein SCP2
MINLQKGQKILLPNDLTADGFNIGFYWDCLHSQPAQLEFFSALLSNDKVRSNDDFIYLDNMASICNSVTERVSYNPYKKMFAINVKKIRPDIDKIIFVANISDSLAVSRGSCTNITTDIIYKKEVIFQSKLEPEKNQSFILLQLYRHNGEWKINSVSQGYNKNLINFIKDYDVTLKPKDNSTSDFNIDDLKNKILGLGDKILKNRDNIHNEEATKTAFVLPFLQIMGYDIFSPNDVHPELTADIGTKKGEKVDYGIFKDNKLIMIVECKSWKENPDIHKSQLHRYFNVTPAKIAIITNGIIYRFYSDIDELNKMDFEPFLEFNILNIDEETIRKLSLFRKNKFNLENILTRAQNWKINKLTWYREEIIRILSNDFENPSPLLIKYFASQLLNKENINNKTAEYFANIVKNALAEFKTAGKNK